LKLRGGYTLEQRVTANSHAEISEVAVLVADIPFDRKPAKTRTVLMMEFRQDRITVLKPNIHNQLRGILFTVEHPEPIISYRPCTGWEIASGTTVPLPSRYIWTQSKIAQPAIPT
jgi:hypothetical protein